MDHEAAEILASRAADLVGRGADAQRELPYPVSFAFDGDELTITLPPERDGYSETQILGLMQPVAIEFHPDSEADTTRHGAIDLLRSTPQQAKRLPDEAPHWAGGRVRQTLSAAAAQLAQADLETSGTEPFAALGRQFAATHDAAEFDRMAVACVERAVVGIQGLPDDDIHQQVRDALLMAAGRGIQLRSGNTLRPEEVEERFAALMGEAPQEDVSQAVHRGREIGSPNWQQAAGIRH